METADIRAELDHRWASSAEVEFLRHHCGKSIDIPADSNTTLVVKASEAHRLLQVLYPDLWKELERARHDAKHPPKKGTPDNAAFVCRLCDNILLNCTAQRYS